MPAKPKPNQSCPCGSGKKFKKCCNVMPTTASGGGNKAQSSLVNGASCSSTHASSSSSFRFSIGDRVLANVGGHYRPGTIVALDYREHNWLSGVPYQIALDETRKLIYAPMDVNECVKPIPTFGIGNLPTNDETCPSKESSDRLVLKRRLRA